MRISIIKGIVVGAVSLAVGACQTTNNRHQQSNEANEVAELVDYTLENGYIKITALSKGCTFFNSFEVKKSDQSESSIEVVRVRDDNCSMKPYNVDLQYSFRHLGIDKNVSVGVINQRRSVPALKSSGTSSN